MLAERGIFGMIWVGEALDVTARYGKLASFVEVGERLTEQLLPLVGLEEEIRALKEKTGAIIDMPGVSIVGPSASMPKANISVYWSREENCYLVVITRHSARSDLEVELSRQIRARLIAEAEVTGKSRELAKANAELARVNGDLEEFASIISHDLKAPMRMLRYIVDEIETSLGEAATPELTAKLADMRAQSRRMTGMLTALLEYASAGRKEEVLEHVDTHALAHAIVHSMRPPPGFQIDIEGIWPAITTLVAPLDLTLRNLIDNAIKHHDRPEGHIRLVGADAGDALVFCVEDDGPGIAPSEHTAVFLPFRRLDGVETEGQGMGLAFVKRWVEAAGGRLELISNPAERRGTTFRLTWPKAVSD
jgi:signal transduction histidine kinase